MPPAGFESAMSASEQPQTQALDHAAIRICITSIKYLILRRCITFEGVQYGTSSVSPVYNLEFSSDAYICANFVDP